MGDIDRIVRSWELSGASSLNLGATMDQLNEVARRLGRPFPNEFVDLYRRCNGGDIVGGNIQLYPLEGEKVSVLGASDFLRANGWPIPAELIVFAGDGASSVFGIWLPTHGDCVAIIIEVGAIFEEGSFAVVGDSLGGFLRGRTAHYLRLCECPEASINELELPVLLWSRESGELDDDDYDACLRWANPGLPKDAVSAYDARLTVEDLRRLAG